MHTIKLDAAVRQDMLEKLVDVDLTLSVLDRLNKSKYTSDPGVIGSIPDSSDPAIVDCRGNFSWEIDEGQAQKALKDLGISVALSDFGEIDQGVAHFSRDGLSQLGRLMLPLVSSGILNGGSATSYADRIKNQAINHELFAMYEARFHRLIDPFAGLPKGLSPGFVQPDESPGPSFIEMKMRSLLVKGVEETSRRTANYSRTLFPLFQMTSTHTNDHIASAYQDYQNSPMLKPLIEYTGIDITRVETGIQPLIAAYIRRGDVWSVFSEAHGRKNSCLPLPGGHGQCFFVLKSIFMDLKRQGKRFIQIGNVDNLGNTPDPALIAILALTQKAAGFEFAFKTPVDVKGGILVRNGVGKLNCADIGPAISTQQVEDAEKGGAEILFNCATGLFSLDYLTSHIDEIIDGIPLRVSHQKKEAGEYAQAEQITWEILSLLDDPIIFGVDKYERFLAAKMFVECMMTSGVGLAEPGFPREEDPARDLYGVAQRLHQGLTALLTSTYGMKVFEGNWIPRGLRDLL